MAVKAPSTEILGLFWSRIVRVLDGDAVGRHVTGKRHLRRLLRVDVTRLRGDNNWWMVFHLDARALWVIEITVWWPRRVGHWVEVTDATIHMERRGFWTQRHMRRAIHRERLSIKCIRTRREWVVFAHIHTSFLTILTNVREGVATHHSNIVAMHWWRGMVYVGGVAGRVWPVAVAVLVMSIVVVLHGHVMSAGVWDVIIVVELLQERASRRGEVGDWAVRRPGVMNRVDVMGIGDNGSIVRMIREYISDWFEVERRLVVSRRVIGLHIVWSKRSSRWRSTGSRSVGVRGVTVKL
jgi:hypothetical protein